MRRRQQARAQRLLNTCSILAAGTHVAACGQVRAVRNGIGPLLPPPLAKPAGPRPRRASGIGSVRRTAQRRRGAGGPSGGRPRPRPVRQVFSGGLAPFATRARRQWSRQRCEQPCGWGAPATRQLTRTCCRLYKSCDAARLAAQLKLPTRELASSVRSPPPPIGDASAHGSEGAAPPRTFESVYAQNPYAVPSCSC